MKLRFYLLLFLSLTLFQLILMTPGFANGDAKALRLIISGVKAGQQFILPASVAPEFSAVSPLSESPIVQATLNGSTYTQGTPITKEGEYFLRVTASDSAGNKSVKKIHFSIRKFPLYKAVAVTAKSKITRVRNKMIVDAYVLFGSNQGDLLDINTTSYRLWVLSKSGAILNPNGLKLVGLNESAKRQAALLRQPVKRAYAEYSIAPAYPSWGDCTPVPTSTPVVLAPTPFAPEMAFIRTGQNAAPAVVYENGYATLHFAGTFPVRRRVKEPLHFEITARAGDTQSTLFDIETEFSAQAAEDPVRVLEKRGIFKEMAAVLIQSSDPPQCDFVSAFKKSARFTYNPSIQTKTCFGLPPHFDFDFQSLYLYMTVEGFSMDASGNAYNFCQYPDTSVQDAHSFSGDFRIGVWLTGTCKKPRMTFSAQPGFTVSANQDEGGSSIVGGLIDVSGSPGGLHVTASGAVGVGDISSSGGKITLGTQGGSIEIPIFNPGGSSVSQSFRGNGNTTVYANSISIVGVSSPYASIRAGVRPLFQSASTADLSLGGSGANIRVQAECNECQCRRMRSFGW